MADLSNANGGKQLLELPQQDTAANPFHHLLDLTTNAKTPLTQQAVGELNLSMLLPVPQYNRSEQLKPIFDFLGEQSDSRNKTSLGENLPVPKDSGPLLSNKKDSSTSTAQDGIATSTLAKQKGISSSSKLPLTNLASNSKPGKISVGGSPTKSQATLISHNTQVNPTSTLNSVPSNNANVHDVLNAISPLSTNVPPPTNLTPIPQVSTTTQPLEGLVKTFLTSKFGQTFAKSLLDMEKAEDTSYKTIMAQHFGSSTKQAPLSSGKTPESQDMIANLISGLIQKPSEHGPASISAANKDDGKKATQLVKQEDSGGTNSLSSATISIGNKEFSLADVSNALNNDKQASNELNGVKTDVELIKDSNKHQKQGNKEKIRKLNEKIATLETLSDALDALTTKLSPEESQGETEQKEIAPSSENPVIQGRVRHNKHHMHHHESDPFSEEIDMLGALLGRGAPHSHAEKETPPVPKEDADSNFIVGIKGNKGLSSKDLQILQSKINQAIEMAETVGRKRDSKQQTGATWLPLLVAGKVGEDVGAQTREEVATIHSNHAASNGIIPSKDSELQALQDILTRLIDNAMRKGTLNQLVKRWDSSGSPFADIAKNISEYLQSNSKLKIPVTRLEGGKSFASKSASNTGIGTAIPINLTSQLAKGIAGLKTGNNDFTTSDLFIKAVNNILGALSKRQGLHKSNSTNRSSFVPTDTLVNFKGILLGGRINKIPHQANPLAEMESKVLAEILRGHENKTFFTNSSKSTNVNGGNKAVDKNSNKIDLLRNNHTQPVQPSPGGQSKEKLTFSSYETKNVSKTIQNNTLMDFMNSMETPEGTKHLPKNTKPGNKHSNVKPPHINNLMTMIAASLLDLNDVQQGNSSKSKSKIIYDDSGIERFPNDHKMSDFSNEDAVLEAPTDHSAKINGSSIGNKRPNELNKSNESPTEIALLQNNTKNFSQNEKGTTGESEKVDLGDQTVTLTLETVDDAPTPSPPSNEAPKIQTGLRNDKVPHYLNVQSAVTLGKINATNSKNKDHSFPQRLIQDAPKAQFDFTTDAKKPEIALPSDDDGKFTTISPSPEVNPGITGNTQTKSNPGLPLGLQMNAIGRIAENADQSSVTPADLSDALTSTSDLSVGSLASKSGETKSFEDKVLPMASDLTLATDTKSGETESIVSKGSPTNVDNPNLINKPSYTATSSESKARPTAAEIREISTSIKALLKILTTYSKKLRFEDDADDSPKGVLPTRSSTASRVADDVSTKEEELVKPWTAGLPATKYNNNVYASFPVSSPTLPRYADSGVYENIQEQPSTEISNYNWNPAPVHAHAQMPSDVSPTKTSLEPQLGADQWRPGNEMDRVSEELKDLNLPSIEDDPTVRAVQKIVADDNAFISQKRKAIQKHEQQAPGVNSQLPGRPGVFGRNTIPKHKGHLRNGSRVEHKKNKKEDAYLSKNNDKRKKDSRGRDIIPRLSNNTAISHQSTSVVGKGKPTIQRNATHHSRNKQLSSKKTTVQNKHKSKLVSSRGEIPGEGVNQNRFNDSAHALKDKEKTLKAKHNLQRVHSNASSVGVTKALKITTKGQLKGKHFGGEKPYDGLHSTKVITDIKSFKKMKSGKPNIVIAKESVTNRNGTVFKLKRGRALNATSKIN